jgi:hypothetical protein
MAFEDLRGAQAALKGFSTIIGVFRNEALF